MALKVPKNKDKACCNDEGEGGSDIILSDMNDMNKIRKGRELENWATVESCNKVQMVAPELIQGPGVLPNRGGKHK